MTTTFTPISTVSELNRLNSDEIVEGYYEGRDGGPEPGHNRGPSVHHGWVNGMIDSGRMEKTKEAADLAREVHALSQTRKSTS